MCSSLVKQTIQFSSNNIRDRSIYKKKSDNITEYLIKALDIYGKNILNIVRAWIIENTKNKVWKFILELLWPEIDIL